MEIVETVTSLLDEIKEQHLLVIVEGKKDRKALRTFGIEHIITLSKKSLYQVIEELTVSEVVILTDFDRTGRTLYAYLSRECNWRGIQVNNRLRLFLLQNTPLTHIEGIPSYLSKTTGRDRRRVCVDDYTLDVVFDAQHSTTGGF